MDGQLKLELFMLLVVLIIARLLFLVHKITTGHTKSDTRKRQNPCKIIICVGSGGHTTELLTLIDRLDFAKYSPRFYIIASNDVTSLSKVKKLESSKMGQSTNMNYNVYKIPRSRNVNQFYLTSILTTLYSILYSVPIVFKIRPDLILCNGPGICVPICLISFLLKAMCIVDTRIVFVESYCRTKTFSLTGKILAYIADNFLVQWPELKKKMKRSEYIGQLM